jgi:formylglycine-generating enzyme required for sulfatase activity
MLLVTIIALAALTQPTDEQLKLLTTFREEFVIITPGEGPYPATFRMGGEHQQEQPQHDVTFADSFEVARYEVPQNLYQAVMGRNPSRWKGQRNAVEMVSFVDATEFCRRATELMRTAKLIENNQVIRLPSEAEWEYFARSGTPTRYSFGDEENQLGEYAWYTGNAAGNDPPVGAKKSNPWGLYDIHGYVWEWCSDVAHDDYNGAPADGSPWLENGRAGQRLLRGGSWKDESSMLRSAVRRMLAEDQVDDAIGFRCVLGKE